MTSKLNRLTDSLGYQFKDQGLLQTALTHRSHTEANNERLEFLGDSILNFLVAEQLYQLFPQASEGELSRMRAQLVKGKTLASIARQFQLGEYLRLGPGEMKSGGHRRDSILADAVEALLGAIYLEAGLQQCRELLPQWLGQRLQQVQPGEASKDAKTRLQEWLQARKRELPVYQLTETLGSEHQQQFVVNCQLAGIQRGFSGSGSNRRAAEQDAAAAALQFLENA